MRLFSLFGRREPADGAAPALEAISTQFGPAFISAAGRREREADAGSAMVADALGAKLLHGWLQNRHQTLMPLTLNMSQLTAEQQEGLGAILASFLLAGRPGAEAAAPAPTLRQWLAGLGTQPSALAAFDEALRAPLPLNVIFDVAGAADLTIYTYVAALMASDARYPVSTMLCDVVQARFDLPTALVRSAVRRYRR